MRDYLAMQHHLDALELAERSARLALLRGARAGDARAIAMLWERYGLRLPVLAPSPLRQAGRRLEWCWPKRRRTRCA